MTQKSLIDEKKCKIFSEKVVIKKLIRTFALAKRTRKGAGVVDRAALEMRCTGNCTGGSNPSLSAKEAKQGDAEEIRHLFLFWSYDTQTCLWGVGTK